MFTLIKNKLLCSFLVLAFTMLTACGGGGGGSPAPEVPPASSKSTLTGIVKQSTGNPLSGATITLEGTTQSTTTNDSGVFILPDTLQGKYVVDIDGTSAAGDAGTSYGILKILASVGADSVSNLEQVIIMPDLSSAATAVDTVTATSGTVSGGVSAINEDVKLDSSGADVSVQIAGVDAEGEINISATPVPLTDLPMSLPETAGANAASFVTIQPANATFNPPLNLTIPNDQGFAPGTSVDIYSFDHDLNDWVNRSAQSTPANKGVVSADGSVIEAIGVITKGGWHGPLLPADFIETVIGMVKDASTPLEGIMVFTSSGQFGVTAADGSFSINVPVVTGAPDIYLTITAPGLSGSVSVVTDSMTPADDSISLDFGMIDLTLPTTGTLTGFSLNTTGPSTESVTITGPVSETFTPAANGAFSITNLPAGDYSASTIFTGDSVETTASFSIAIGQITVLTLQQSSGNDVVVKVFIESGDNVGNPLLANDSDRKATVTISQGNTALTQTTDANGLASFSNITGSMTVTGQLDYTSTNGFSARSAYTAHDITPANGQVGIVIARFDLAAGVAVQGTEIQGRISNIPAIPAGFELVVVVEEITEGCCDRVSEIIDQASIVNGTVDYTISTNGTFGLGDGDYVVMALIAKDDSNGHTRYNTAAVFPTKVTATAAQVTPNINLNFADVTMKYEFVTKDITVNNPLALTSSSFATIASDVKLSSGEEFSFFTYTSDFQTSPAYPSSADFVSASPGGVLVNYYLSSETIDFTTGISQEKDVSLAPTAATAITFDTLSLPVITSPTSNQVITAQQAKSMTVGWTVTEATDAVLVHYFTDGQGSSALPGVDFVLWQHAVAGNTNSMTIPVMSENSLPMFESDMSYRVDVDLNEMSIPFNFSNVFDFDVYSNIQDITYTGNLRESIRGVVFETSP